MYLFLVLSILTILLIKYANWPTPRPIFSIYRRPDKWYCLKTVLFYLFLKLRKDVHNLKHVRIRTEDSAEGMKYQSIIEKLKCSQKSSSSYPKAADSMYFNASNSDGYYLIIGIAIRPHGIVNGFLYVKVPGIGLLESLKLPDTMLFQDDVEKSLMLYGAEGLHLTCLKQMKKIKISYYGKMKVHDNSKKMYNVLVDVVWSSNFPSFDLDWDVDPMMLAKTFAKEPWNSEFFETLKDNRQTHYEQHGNMKGIIVINGDTYTIKLSSLRNHIYGLKQQWKNFHRYVLHIITLEDGTRINVGVVSTPITFSSKEYGYICKPNGELQSISYCSMKLYEHGEKGTPPIDYSFTIKAGENSYQIQVNIMDSAEFYIGWQWEAKIVECMAKFRVDGASGWGGVEWHYRYIGGRPSHVSCQDPEWTTMITV